MKEFNLVFGFLVLCAKNPNTKHIDDTNRRQPESEHS